jgi:hypothetical protein
MRILWALVAAGWLAAAATGIGLALVARAIN